MTFSIIKLAVHFVVSTRFCHIVRRVDAYKSFYLTALQKLAWIFTYVHLLKCIDCFLIILNLFFSLTLSLWCIYYWPCLVIPSFHNLSCDVYLILLSHYQPFLIFLFWYPLLSQFYLFKIDMLMKKHVSVWGSAFLKMNHVFCCLLI